MNVAEGSLNMRRGDTCRSSILARKSREGTESCAILHSMSGWGDRLLRDSTACCSDYLATLYCNTSSASYAYFRTMMSSWITPNSSCLQGAATLSQQGETNRPRPFQLDHHRCSCITPTSSSKRNWGNERVRAHRLSPPPQTTRGGARGKTTQQTPSLHAPPQHTETGKKKKNVGTRIKERKENPSVRRSAYRTCRGW